MTMEESITENISVREEPLAFKRRSRKKAKRAENMIGKVVTNLAKVCFVI